jgi:metal-responsive CopG/Arc/MetJ family transcriptional regulator
VKRKSGETEAQSLARRELVKINAIVPIALKEAIDQEADRLLTTRSEVIREALEARIVTPNQ